MAEQAVVKRGINTLQFREFGAVSEEKVLLSVVVVIQDRDPAAHRLREILSSVKIVV